MSIQSDSESLEINKSGLRRNSSISSTFEMIKSFSGSMSSANYTSTSSIGAAWNIINIIIGIGILGIPYAIMTGGWIGIVLTVLAAIVCCSTGNMIIDCLYERVNNNKFRVYHDYPSIGAKVWPRFGHRFVVAISLIDMFGASTLYVILLGTSSYSLFSRLKNELTEQYWFVIGACLVLCLLFFKKMSTISWFSLIAVFSLLGTLITIISYCMTKYTDINLRNIYSLSAEKLPISAGIIVFSYCAHPVLPAIEACMKYPESYTKVLNISFIIATLTKLLFGIVPVCIFGNNTFQTISNNVLYSDLGFFISTKFFVILNVFFSMPLVIYIVLDTIDKSILHYFHPIFSTVGKLHFLWIFTSRAIAITAILLIALIVPYFALVMSFVGSFTATCLTFILPCWFSLVLKANELNICQKLYRITVIALGIFIGIMGMVMSVIEMYKLSIR